MEPGKAVNRLKVLLVDGKTDDAQAMTAALGRDPDQPFELEHVASLETALGRMDTKRFDVVLTELELPDASGLSVVERFMTRSPDTPVVVLTRLNDKVLALESVRKGAQDFLVKNLASVGAVARTIRFAHERKSAERALKQSEDRFRRLAENSPDLYFRYLLEPVDRYEYVNQAVTKMLGYTPQEIYAEQYMARKLVHPDDAHLVELARKGREDTGKLAVRFIHKNGAVVWLELEVAAILDPEGKPYALEGVGRDITARKRTENIVLSGEENRQLAVRLDAIGRLAAGLSDGFNNLMTTVLGYAELLQRRTPPDDPARGPVAEIVRAGERAVTLTRQLLALGGRQPVHREMLAIAEVVGAMEPTLRKLIGAEVELVLQLDRGEARVRVDRGQLEHVVMNLAANAWEAMPRGGKLIIESATVTLDEAGTRQRPSMRPGPYVRLSVSDTGSGMDAETLSHVFEPFFTTKQSDQKAGLGLATVYGIIKQNDGFVWPYSEPGQGTAFKIYLPVAGGAAESARTADAEPGTPSAGAVAETILLAENDDSIRRLSAAVLTSAGYRVLVAADGEEALRVAGGNPGTIHLLLSDVVMPKLEGHQLAAKLSAVRPGLKVLLMSGYTAEVLSSQGRLPAGAGFLEKPFLPETLVRRVREALATPQARKD
jgi:two-component system cell cycle sensor histidine kinase/response regulator CckA